MAGDEWLELYKTSVILDDSKMMNRVLKEGKMNFSDIQINELIDHAHAELDAAGFHKPDEGAKR